MQKPILIDPFEKTIKTVEFDGDFKDIQRLIECNIFTIAPLSHAKDSVYVDDEGLLTLTQDSKFFYMPHLYPTPLVGKGLVFGRSPSGDSVTPTLTEDDLSGQVVFLDLPQVQAMSKAGKFDG